MSISSDFLLLPLLNNAGHKSYLCKQWYVRCWELQQQIRLNCSELTSVNLYSRLCRWKGTRCWRQNSAEQRQGIGWWGCHRTAPSAVSVISLLAMTLCCVVTTTHRHNMSINESTHIRHLHRTFLFTSLYPRLSPDVSRSKNYQVVTSTTIWCLHTILDQPLSGCAQVSSRVQIGMHCVWQRILSAAECKDRLSYQINCGTFWPNFSHELRKDSKSLQSFKCKLLLHSSFSIEMFRLQPSQLSF